MSLPTSLSSTQDIAMSQRGNNRKPKDGNRPYRTNECVSPTALDNQNKKSLINPSRSTWTPEEKLTLGKENRTCSSGIFACSLAETDCGVSLSPKCLAKRVNCRVCSRTQGVRAIRGMFSYSEVAITLPGHSGNKTVKITYNIADGIRGECHPSLGAPFSGGVFEAYLPLTGQTRRLLPGLERAFSHGLTFTVIPDAWVTWSGEHPPQDQSSRWKVWVGGAKPATLAAGCTVAGNTFLTMTLFKDSQTVRIFAPSQLPANQEHRIHGTGVLGAGREQKRGPLEDWSEEHWTMNQVPDDC